LTEGSVWTTKELETSLSRGLLFKQTTSTETRIKDPNVKGRNITLRALNGSVGTDNGEIVIDGSNPDELKDEQKRIALAAAEADDVAVDNDIQTIRVLLRKSVNVAASGNIDVEAKDNVYLGSRDPIYVKTVQTGESIRIKSADGIYTVSTSGPAAIQGGRTILEGRDGGLGTVEAPLTLALKTNAELTARAAGDIHIRETVGNLNLAEVFGTGNVVLQAKESILDSRGERFIAIMGNGVNLTAEEGSIGTAANPLYLTVNPSGQLTAYALKGDVHLATPSTNLVNLNDISAGGNLAVVTAGQLSIHGRLAAAEALSISANGTLLVESSGRLDARGRLTLMGEEVLMAEGSSGESADGIDITAANGVEASQLVTDNDVQIAAGTTITQAGNGSITAQTLRTSSGGQQILEGANQIASFGAANTGGGSIKLNNMSALSITGITQEAGGNVDITNAGLLQILGTVSTADQVELNVAGRIVEGAAGKVHAERLATSSIGGQVLLGDNRIGSFQASNQGDDIELGNNGPDLEVISINQADGGDIALTNNEGGLTITGLVRTRDGVDLTAQGTIEQAGGGRIEEAASLTTASIGGQKLSGANTVHSFQGTNASGGKVELNNAASGLKIIAIAQGHGGDIELTNAGELEISGAISTTGQVELDVIGRIAEGAAGRVHAERLVTSSVGGQLLLGDNRIRSLQASNQGDDIELNNTGYALEVISVNQADGGDIALTNNEGGLGITGLVRTRDSVNLTAQGTIDQAGGGRIEEAASLTIASIGGQKLSGANTVHSFQGTNAGGGMVELNNAASSLEIIAIAQADGGDIELTNVGELAILGQISSTAGDISVAADGTIHSTHGDVSIRGKDITLEAKEGGIGSKEIRVVAVADGRTNLSADLDIFFEERETDLDSDFIISEHGSVDLLVPAGGINVDELRAAGSITVGTSRSVFLGSTIASQLNLYVSGINAGVSVAEALITEGLTVNADHIEFANLIHTGVEPLQVSMGGGSKRMADSITVSGRSPVGMVFELLEGDTMAIEADTDNLKFTEVVLGTKAHFGNRYHTVIADNVNRQLVPCDLQLYPERDPFYLIMGRDRLIRTNAWVVNYHDDYIINDFATENSFMRITSKMPQIVGFAPRQDIGFSSSTFDDATSPNNIIISASIYDSLQPGSSGHDDDDEESAEQ
ncbi:MAG: hypothetical protein GX977_07315, partial [Firmicutes bacterium]|nr:hypothetical protein [Bacillota bacterium]